MRKAETFQRMERRGLLDLGHRCSGDSVCDVMWALLLHCCGYWLGSSHSVQAKKKKRKEPVKKCERGLVASSISLGI